MAYQGFCETHGPWFEPGPDGGCPICGKAHSDPTARLEAITHHPGPPDVIDDGGVPITPTMDTDKLNEKLLDRQVRTMIATGELEGAMEWSEETIARFDKLIDEILHVLPAKTLQEIKDIRNDVCEQLLGFRARHGQFNG